MKIHRLYTDDKGESHFTDADVEYVETTQAGRLSKRLPATGIIFREVPPTYDLDWHPAPRRQYIINLNCVTQFNRNENTLAMNNGKHLPIARNQKDKLTEKFGWL